MNFIVWLIVGGLIGWLASILMRTHYCPVRTRTNSTG